MAGLFVGLLSRPDDTRNLLFPSFSILYFSDLPYFIICSAYFFGCVLIISDAIAFSFGVIKRSSANFVTCANCLGKRIFAFVTFVRCQSFTAATGLTHKARLAAALPAIHAGDFVLNTSAVMDGGISSVNPRWYLPCSIASYNNALSIEG